MRTGIGLDDEEGGLEREQCGCTDFLVADTQLLQHLYLDGICDVSLLLVNLAFFFKLAPVSGLSAVVCI